MAGEKVFSFQCLQCASPIPVHALGQSLSYACRSCGAVVAEDSQGVRILQHVSQKMLWQPLLELGSKAKFRGETWQVLGFMVRSDAAEEYFWSEYLLYNPYQGFRWLNEAEGHWNFILMTRHKPSGTWNSGAVWGGRTYSLFLRGQARVKFVLGEFYWRVRIGDEVEVRDYIAPPDMLSCEGNGTEEMWSAGSYVDPEDIRKSFQLTGPLPVPRGVAPNQPSLHSQKRNKLLLHWGAFACAILLLQMIMASGSHEESVLQTQLVRHPQVPVEILRSESFELAKDNSHIAIQFRAPVNDSWVHLRTTLVGEDGQLAQPVEFGRDIVNMNEPADEAFLNHLSKGRYHLDIVSEAGWDDLSPIKDRDLPISVSIKENSTLIGPFLLSLLLISLYPFWILVLGWRFESNRWANSDRG